MRRQLTVLTALCALLLTSIGSTAPPARAAGEFHGYDWTVSVETQELERYFDYKKSGLSPLDRIDIDYYPGEDEKSQSPTHYQKLWYHDGQPLGLERLQKFGVTQGENITVRITHKGGRAKPGELKAAANAILRIWLDAQLNQNQLGVIKVPGQSLQAIANELVQKQRFVVVPEARDVEAPIMSTMTLLLESEADGKKVNLAYL